MYQQILENQWLAVETAAASVEDGSIIHVQVKLKRPSLKVIGGAVQSVPVTVSFVFVRNI